MNRRPLTAALIVLVAAGALLFRLPRLRARPMHADEANQAHKAGVLHDQGRYRYDPHEHHGPTLYYLTQPVFWLSGAESFAQSTETTYRIVPVLFGTGLVLLLLLVRDGIGRQAALCAAVLTAVSPSLLYYSRYYIQETLLVFLTFLAIAAGWRYKRTRGLGWLLLLGAAVGLMHATKETAVVAWGALAIALAAKLGWRAWRRRAVRRRRGLPPSPAPSVAERRFPAWHFALAALVAGAVSTLFFSSFLAHPEGVVDSVRAYGTYLSRSGGERSHEHPWHYYLSLLIFSGRGTAPWWVPWSFGLVVLLVMALVAAAVKRRGASITQAHVVLRILAVAVVGLAAAYALIPSVQLFVESLGRGRRGGPWWSEGLVVALAVAGMAAGATRCGVSRSHAPLVRVLSVYTVVLTAAYSLVPYKTPWCALGFVHGMVLLAGVGAVATVRVLPLRPLRGVAWLLLAAAAYQYAAEAHRASFRFATYPTNPYCYVHTSSDVVRLGERVEALARVHPDGQALLVKVIAWDPWPLPWYLRRLPRVGYWAEPPADPSAPVVIAEDALAEPIGQALAETHRAEVYGLRRGVHLVAFVEEGLRQAWTEAQASSPP